MRQSLISCMGLTTGFDMQLFSSRILTLYLLLSAKALGHMAFEWSEQGYCGDKGYFIARAVLQ
jgi:hypothetical protein